MKMLVTGSEPAIAATPPGGAVAVAVAAGAAGAAALGNGKGSLLKSAKFRGFGREEKWSTLRSRRRMIVFVDELGAIAISKEACRCAEVQSGEI